MKNVLVLCTGNSCRSITAEALINHLYPGPCRAGSAPSGRVHPKSIKTLERHGIKQALDEGFRLLETRIKQELA